MQNYDNETMKALTKRLLACKNGSNRGTFMQRYNSSSGGHEQALEKVYQNFWSKDSLITDCTGGDNPGSSYLDTNMGIDYIVSVKNPKLKTEMDFWVQERFRSEKYRSYQSISLIHTQANDNAAEVFKTKAQYLVYGYLNDETKELTQCVIVDLAKALGLIANDRITFEIKNNRFTSQTFLTVNFIDLKEAGCLLFEYNAPAIHS